MAYRIHTPQEEAAFREAYYAMDRHERSYRAVAKKFNTSYGAVQRAISHPREEAQTAPAPAVDIEAVIRKVLAEQEAKAAAGKLEVVEAAPVYLRPKNNIVECPRQYERIAFLSDIHHPFHDKPALAAVLHALKDYRPQLLILGGDYFDAFSISDHDREPGRVDTLQDEFDASRDTSRTLDELGCEQVVFIAGNHEERLERMQRRNPGLFKLRALELPRAAELPQRWLYYPDQTRLRIGSLTALHGNLKGRGTSMQHAAAGMIRKLRTTCIAGHLHRFQTFMETSDDGTVRAGFANGHLSDINEARYITNPDWQQGCSLIDYSWSDDIFAVTPLLVIRNKLMFRGQVYSGSG